MIVRKKITINKGNYILDTLSRERQFHRYLSIGWEKKYKEYRKHWSEYPSRQYVAEYPLLVDIELSAVCNLACPMCYTNTEHFKKAVGVQFMNFNLFKKIIDEISNKVDAIRLSLRGESTLHPQFIDCIRYAKQNKIREISVLTNGSKLKKNFFKKIMEAGIDWITISVDGMNKMYESIRKPLKFKETFQRIKDIKEVKDDNERHKPVIKIQAIWPSIRENPEGFYNIFAPYVDLIAFNPLIDYLCKDSEQNILYEKEFLCPQHYQRMVIVTDGSALMCANDENESEKIGNVNKETIYDIWHGERLNRIRSIHKKKNGFMNISVCKRCYLPRLTENKEMYGVNGRDVIVKNYVNRRQTIGE